MNPSSPSVAETPETLRWTAKRKAALVLDLIRGKITTAEASRQHGLTVQKLDAWKEDFIAQGTEALRSHPRDRQAQWEAKEKDLLAKVGELTLAVDILKKTHRILGKDLPEGFS
jgi:transposase-like protein